MYELSVQREFTAAHAVTMAGRREPSHSHHWRVTAVVSGRHLDEDGILCDFEAVQNRLGEILRPFEIDAHLGQVMQAGARAFDAVLVEILRRDQPFDVVDRLLGLLRGVTRMMRFRFDNAGGAGKRR